MNTTKWLLCLGACALGLQLQAAPMGSAFTYQGRLNSSGGQARDGIYDFRFTLYNAATAGSVVGVADDVSAVPVTNGLFTVQIDFSTSPFVGEVCWLQLQVNTNAAVPLITLNPRQRLTPTPQAIYADTASYAYNAGFAATASGVTPNAVGPLGLANEAVTSAKIADETIDADDLNPSLLRGTFWRLTGNDSTTPGINFLGTTDNQAVEFRVNNRRMLRLEPAFNVIGGQDENRVTAGVSLATIAGGEENVVSANFGVISGGSANRISSSAISGVIAGGEGNEVLAAGATISGGRMNVIQTNAFEASVGGGAHNAIESDANYASINGGYAGQIGRESSRAVISGGEHNKIKAQAQGATIAGGQSNTIETDAYGSVIGGGSFHTIGIDAYGAIIGGGSNNHIENDSSHSIINGGTRNRIGVNTVAATVGGGTDNYIDQDAAYAVINGGDDNTIGYSAWHSIIGGGRGNTIELEAGRSIIGGGEDNTVEAQNQFATIAGGHDNLVATNSTYGTIGGGAANKLATIVLGGEFANTNAPHYSVIGGGQSNVVNGADWATVPGGSKNAANGNYSFAAGRRAKANHHGAFVWADSADADFASVRLDQFRVRAAGGMEVVGGSGSPAFQYSGSRNGGLFSPVGLAENNNASGQSAPALRVINQGGNSIDGALSVSAHGTGYIATFGNAADWVSRLTTDGTWTALAFNATSDREAKENFQPVDARAVLDQVANMPMTRWNYKAAAGVSHIGPMAQDFHAAFGVGTDDKHIATVDADGVALAAIQGLNQKVEEQRAENARLKGELDEIKRLVHALTQHPNGGGQ